MKPWKYQIDISAEHDACRRHLDREIGGIESAGEAITPAECGRRVAAKIRACPAFRDEEHGGTLERIADEFESLDDDGDTDCYDEVLKALYDWADSYWPNDRLCWVKTIG